LHSRRNQEQIEVRECLLSFSAEYFIFQFAIEKRKDLRYSFIHSVFCLTTGPKPPPKQRLHIV